MLRSVIGRDYFRKAEMLAVPRPEAGCYLTAAEMGIDGAKKAELGRSGEVFQLPG